jgi:hypothetical protein
LSFTHEDLQVWPIRSTETRQRSAAQVAGLALPLKIFAQPGDRGLGDIVARKIGLARGETFKAWFKAKFNRDCGCADRRVWLNQRFSLNQK